jgi:hypothetical protein
MSAHERACALAGHLSADLKALAAAVGTELPKADGVRALIEAGQGIEQVRRAVLELYVDIRNRLAATNVSAATAFGLGRMLADTVLLPTSETPQLIGERFDKYRLEHAIGWLDDLDSKLPRHAAGAVRTSLNAWQAWVDDRRSPGGSFDGTKLDS